MTIKKKETRGKPPRYEGEKSERISVLVRPRYRQILDIIAKDRNSTLSEAMELAISKLGREYKISTDAYGHMNDITPFVADYVRSPYEAIDRIYFSLIPLSGVLEKFNIAKKPDTYEEIMNSIKNIPDPLLTSLQNHIGEVIHDLKPHIKYFSPIYLQEAIEEDWKEGISIDLTILHIKIVNKFYKEMTKELLKLNPPINPDATYDEMKEYLSHLNDPHQNIDETLEALHDFYDPNSEHQNFLNSWQDEFLNEDD